METKNKINNKGFEFKESSHRYSFNGRPMTGCTTILGMIAKPALIGWAANMAVDYIIANEDPDTKGGDSFLTSRFVLEEARKAHRMKRDKAAESGTDVHAEIEQCIKKAIQQLGGYFSEEWAKATSDKEKQLENFINWAVKNKIKFLESEKQVYSEKHFVAGTYDFKCEIEGKIYIGDIKTSSGIYDRTPLAQAAAYQMMELENEPDNQIDGRLVINIKKNGIFDEDKDVYVSEHYEDDLAIFMAALTLYRQLKNKFEPLSYQFKNK